MGFLAPDPQPDLQPLLDEPGDDRQVARRAPEIDAHGIELLDRDQRGRVVHRGRRTDKVAELHLQLADPALDRREHPAVAEIDLGGLEIGPGLVDLGLGRQDVDLVIGQRLLQAGAVRLDLGRALLDLGLGLVIIFLGSCLPRHQVAFPALLHPIELKLGLVEGDPGFGHLLGPGLLGLLERGLGLLEDRLRLRDLDLERLFFDDQQKLVFLDVRALGEMHLLEEPLHPRSDRHLVECPRRPVGKADDRHVHLAGPYHSDRRHRGLAWSGGRRARAVAAAQGRSHRRQGACRQQVEPAPWTVEVIHGRPCDKRRKSGEGAGSELDSSRQASHLRHEPGSAPSSGCTM